MNFIKKISVLLILIISLIYITNISGLSSNIILFDGEKLNLKTIFGITISKEPIITTSTNNEESNIVNEEVIHLSLFNFINVKNIDVTTIKNTKVVPLGNTIGLKLYSSGVFVIGMSEIEGKKPYEKSTIKEGDLIIFVNNTQVTTTDELIKCVNNCEGKILEITYVRNGEEYVTSVEPVITKQNEYKLRIMGKRWSSRNRYSNIL